MLQMRFISVFRNETRKFSPRFYNNKNLSEM